MLALLDEISELEQQHCGTALLEREEDHAKTVSRLLDELESVQKTSAARLGAIDTTHKMFQRERDRADAAEKRNSELSQKAESYDMLREDYGPNGSLVDFVDWQAKRIAEYRELISSLVAVSSSILREVERINKAAVVG